MATSLRHRDAQQRRHQAGAHRDAGRRPVLGDGALGQVHVDVGAAVEVAVQPQRRGARAHVADRRLRRLLHDVAELAGEHQLALARDDRDLGRQQIAAVHGDGQAVDQPDLVLPLLAARSGTGAGPGSVAAACGDPPAVAAAVAERAHGRLLGDDVARDLAADGRDLALEAADARLLRVVVDDVADGVLGDLDLDARRCRCRCFCFGHQVALGDRDLLELGVAGELDDLHAVLQRDRGCPAGSSPW